MLPSDSVMDTAPLPAGAAGRSSVFPSRRHFTRAIRTSSCAAVSVSCGEKVVSDVPLSTPAS